MVLDLFYILVIVSYGVGVSGFFRKFKKPLSCETCMTFWCCLAYLIFTGNFTLLGVALSCLASLLATPVAGFLTIIREMFNWILVKITPR